jgi:nucleoside-diphosphate-sugar epimerase
MRVLVIGGTNFIGPPTIEMLAAKGHEVTVFHRGRHEVQFSADVRHVHSPYASMPVRHVPESLADPPPEVVLYMVPVGEEDAVAVMSRFHGVARRIVGISSGDVYRAYGRLTGIEPGPPDPIPLTEDAPLREVLYPHRAPEAGPEDWTFHYEKILVERVLQGDSELPSTILRLPAVYGPGDPNHRLRPHVLRMYDRRPRIPLASSLASWRWTHGYVDNIAHAIALAVTSPDAAGRVYNVGEELAPTAGERVQRLGTTVGWRGKVTSIRLAAEHLPPHLRPPYDLKQNLVMDTRRIREELGYKEIVSEDDGLRRTAVWEWTQPSVEGDPTPEEYAVEESL